MVPKSLKSEKRNKENNFYKSFGAFASEKSAEEIIAELKSSRKFRRKEIKL
jgi:ribosomal protein L20A (L18A)